MRSYNKIKQNFWIWQLSWIWQLCGLAEYVPVFLWYVYIFFLFRNVNIIWASQSLIQHLSNSKSNWLLCKYLRIAVFSYCFLLFFLCEMCFTLRLKKERKTISIRIILLFCFCLGFELYTMKFKANL